jgi:DNA invertase Pin-like site-specific DNA recombinase
MSLETKPDKRLIGYARVSTQQQDLARQTKALERLGCAVVYADKASGKSMAGRPELARALDDLDTGDELVIAEWDRATRSMWDGLQIIKAVIDAGASIKVLDRSYIDLETPMGRGFMAMMSAMAEDERLRIIAQSVSASKHRNSSSAEAMRSDSSSSLIGVPDSEAAASRRSRLSSVSSSGTASRAISSTNSLNGSLMDQTPTVGGAHTACPRRPDIPGSVKATSPWSAPRTSGMNCG